MWRNCRASLTLVDEINARWPNRDKTSDGTIGDAAHATRHSDHNPWVKDANGVGVVRARDIDKDGIDAAWLAEHLRRLGASGDPRLRPGGYVIFNRRITNPDFRAWRTYTGSNPHTSHIHVSFTTNPAGFDSTAPWGIAEEDLFMALSAEQQKAMFDAIMMMFAQVTGDTDWHGPDGWGWETWRHDGGPDLTPVDLLRSADRELNSRLGLADRPGPDTDTLFGHVLSLRAEVRRLEADLSSRMARVEEALRRAGVDPVVVREAVAAALDGGMEITGRAVPAGPKSA